jgi:hypothetical protein
VCSRHCRALLRKHVLPLLNSPLPMLHVIGQVESITPRNKEALLAFDGGSAVFADFTGVDGGGLASSRC